MSEGKRVKKEIAILLSFGLVCRSVAVVAGGAAGVWVVWCGGR